MWEPRPLCLQTRAAALSAGLFFLAVKQGKSGFDVPATAFSSPDPRHDHKGVLVVCWFPGIEPMPPLESLFRPLRLKMKCWSRKRQEWQASTTQALAAVDEGSIDCFAQLEQMKQVAVDCA